MAGSLFGADTGRLTAFGAFAAVAPAVHLMDTGAGWGRDGRNALAVPWAVDILAWFLESRTLPPTGLGVAH